MSLRNEGIKVSQAGYDAQDTGDIHLLMSSGWPSLKIEATGVGFLDGSSDIDLYQHNLNYPPFFLVFQFDDAKTYLMGARQSVSEPRFYVTDNKLAVKGDSSGGPFINVRWYVCRLPLNQPFQAPIYNLSDQAASKQDNNIGIKVLKPGKDPSSTDLRDYTLHSGTRSPQIHNVTTGLLPQIGPNDYKLSWTNDLGYFPLYFAFQRNDTVFPEDAGRWFGPVNISPYTANASSNLTAFDVSDQAYASIVVFKDPFLALKTQEVAF